MPILTLKDGRAIEYTLTRKNVKRINVRVLADGSVAVSAPKNAPARSIERLLTENADRIVEASLRGRRRSDGDGVVLYGVRRRVVAVKGEPARAYIAEDGSVVLTLPEPGDAGASSRVLEAFLRAECERTVRTCVDRLMPRFASRGVEYPVIRFNRAKSRWGSCAAGAGRLNFSYATVMLPPECILLVAAHELTHFLVPDHSPAFYAELEKVVPNHKELRGIMKEYSPSLFFS
jgi:predicted metal-dependent hydrolase